MILDTNAVSAWIGREDYDRSTGSTVSPGESDGGAARRQLETLYNGSGGAKVGGFEGPTRVRGKAMDQSNGCISSNSKGGPG